MPAVRSRRPGGEVVTMKGQMPTTVAGWLRGFIEWGILGAMGTAAILMAEWPTWTLGIIWATVVFSWVSLAVLWRRQAKNGTQQLFTVARCVWCRKKQMVRPGAELPWCGPCGDRMVSE